MGAITGSMLEAARAKIKDDAARMVTAICIHCDAQVEEDSKHVAWECPAWAAQREVRTTYTGA